MSRTTTGRARGRARRVGLGLAGGVLVWCAVGLAQQPPPAQPTVAPTARVEATAAPTAAASGKPAPGAT
ncbi:MAG: hypothetical protein HY908_33930, partial [Myxococcales bacterium]|nr:hypothetical protein [Myxococcales bacterium]